MIRGGYRKLESAAQGVSGALFCMLPLACCCTLLSALLYPLSHVSHTLLSRPAADGDEMDAALGRAAAQALGGREGTIIVMDPRGERLRAVVNPDLATGQAFAPGSTIKPFTTLAALRAGLIGGNSRLLCRGRYARDDFEITCSHPEIHAPFGPPQALAYSCNHYFGKLGERLEQNTFDATLAPFGLIARGRGEPPGRASRALGEDGQLLVTPMQLITAYAALFDGGRTARHGAGIDVAPEHRRLLIEGMRGAVTYGTAERAALSRIPLHIFGKTGTSSAGSGGAGTHGWFIGLASEREGTRGASSAGVTLAVLVFLKDAHGAQCAELARPVFEEYARRRSHGEAADGRGAASAPTALPAHPLTSAPLVRVRTAREGVTRTLPFEEYVLGVISAEGSAEDQLEALKALAVSVRTYALRNPGRHAREGYDFCSTTHCQLYAPAGGAGARAGDLQRRGAAETAGEVLRDEYGRTADAYFHAACGGMTAHVETLWGAPAPKYLRGVRDGYCAARPRRSWTDVIPSARLAGALRSDPRTDTGARLDRVVVTRRDATGRAELIALEGERRRVVRGWDFKIIVGRSLGWHLLKSSRFEVGRAGGDYVFRGSGFGHGLGLCQEGAHVMARRGASYRQILEHYFPGAGVGGGAWKADLMLRAPVAGDPAFVSRQAPAPTGGGVAAARARRLNLSAGRFRVSYPAGVRRGEAELVLRTLEAARVGMSRRLAAASVGLPEPAVLDVIIHDTTGNFVAATGQPAWVAAATRGRRIEIQPLEVLRRRGILETTLRHEYAHTAIEALGRGRTPRWLAEGLAIYVAGEGAFFAGTATKTGLSAGEIERRLAGPASPEQMRALYAAAYREVCALIRAEGEAGAWRRVVNG